MHVGSTHWAYESVKCLAAWLNFFSSRANVRVLVVTRNVVARSACDADFALSRASVPALDDVVSNAPGSVEPLKSSQKKWFPSAPQLIDANAAEPEPPSVIVGLPSPGP